MRKVDDWQKWRQCLDDAVQPGELKPLGFRSLETGEVISCDVGLFRILNVHTPPQYVVHTQDDVQNDSHPCYIISAIIHGNLKIEQDGVVAELSVGDLFVRDSTKPSKVSNDSYGHAVVIKVSKSTISRMGVSWPDETLYLPNSNVAAAAAYAYIIQVAENVLKIKEKMKAAISENILTNLLTAFEYSSQNQDKYSADRLYQRACDIIMKRLKDSELSIASLATELEISTRYLHRLFNRRNQAVDKFIWDQRLIRCRGDILDPDQSHIPLIEIAYNWGFSDPSHFSRVFKSRFGIQPSALRKIVKSVS